MPLLTTAVPRSSVRIASNGDAWFAVWDDNRTGDNRIYGARISSTGQVLDPEGFAICKNNSKQNDPTVTFGGTTYFVAWSDYRDQGTSDPDIYGARVLPNGAVQEPNGLLISDDTNAKDPTLAHGGTDFMVAWSNGNVNYARVGYDGQRIDLTDKAVTGPPMVTGGSKSPRLVFDGTQYLLGWVEDASSERYCVATRISTAGVVLDNSTLLLSDGVSNPQEMNCEFASNGSNFFAAWSKAGHPNYPIHTRRISTQGVILDQSAQAPSRSANFQSSPSGAYGAGTYIASWHEFRHTDLSELMQESVYATQVENATSGLIIPPIATAMPANHSAPLSMVGQTVAFDGTNFLIVWADVETPQSIWGARITPQNLVLDNTPIKIADDAGGDQMSVPTVAFSGGAYWVVWANSSSPNSDQIGARVSPSGTVLTANPFPITSVASVQSAPAIAATSDQVLVSWIDGRTGSNQAVARRLNAQGQLLETNPVALGDASVAPLDDSTGMAVTPAVAASNDKYLVSWSAPSGTGHMVVARRVHSDGTLPGSQPKEIWAAPNMSPETDLVYDGTNFVIAWSEFYDTIGLYGPPRLTTLGARLDPAANLVNPIPVIIADEGNVALTNGLMSDGQGTVIALYSNYDSTPAVSMTRVYARSIVWPNVGQNCSAASDCPSFGFCVDGVCCNTACGNGDTGDCQACSKAAGALDEGLCGPIVGGTVCRAAVGACDKPEQCDGVSS
jgi:hypothetical protein